jgi:uncharacterized protein YerC
MKTNYPENFLRIVYEDYPLSLMNVDEVMKSEDCLNGFEKVMNEALSETQRDIIFKKCKEGKTYVAIAEEAGVSPSCIRTKFRRACCVIRRPEWTRYIRKGRDVVCTEEMRKEQERRTEKAEEEERIISCFPDVSYQIMRDDLSTRAYNALERLSYSRSCGRSAGEVTIRELDEMTNLELHFSLRGAGDKTIEDIRMAIAKTKENYNYRA